MNPTTLDRQLDLFTAKLRRTLGMKAVEYKTDAGWRDAFESTALYLLDRNSGVTAEEVVEAIGYPQGVSPNAIGAAMRRVALKHGLTPTYEKSKRVSRHAAVVARWSRE